MYVIALVFLSILSTTGLAYAPSTQAPTVTETTTHETKITPQPAKAKLIDGIAVAIFGQEGVDIITKSDLNRPALDGSMPSVEDRILEHRMFQDAKKLQMDLDEDMIERGIKTIERENNLTREQLKEVFKSAGYTYEEGRQQFGMMSAVNQVLDFKIRSRLIIPEKEVRAYYQEHPVYEQAAYFIERALVPFSTKKSKTKQKRELAGLVERQEDMLLEWGEPFWIKEDDLAHEKHFITELQEGQMTLPVETEQGFEFFRLKQKQPYHLKSLEERYMEITTILRRPRYEKLFTEYKKNLFEEASLVYFN